MIGQSLLNTNEKCYRAFSKKKLLSEHGLTRNQTGAKSSVAGARVAWQATAGNQTLFITWHARYDMTHGGIT
jgi:hypothetical protein